MASNLQTNEIKGKSLNTSHYLFKVYNGGNAVRLSQNFKGISKLALILLLLISFAVGSLLSYVWTMGYYAPSEYHLPKQANVAIENVYFPLGDALSFNVTVLNPSYSSNITIEQIKVETPDGKLHDTMTPSLPTPLARSTSQTFRSFWNWGNYTGQTVRLHVFASEGLGSNVRAITPFMNFSVVSVNFDPSVSAKHFNITVQNAGSPTFVNITKILVNGVEVSTEPTLATPYGLTNASDVPPVKFMLRPPEGWAALNGSGVLIAVQTLQGYTTPYKTWTAPRVVLSIIDVSFDAAISFDHFNITVLNTGISAADVDIGEVIVYVAGNLTQIQNWTAFPSPKLERNIPARIFCTWDWRAYRGQEVAITVVTVQGFQVTKTTHIP